MKVRKQIANSRIIVIKKTCDNKIKSKTNQFHSKNNIQKIMDRVQKFLEDYPGDIKSKIKYVDKRDGKIKSTIVHTCLDQEKLSNMIQEKMSSYSDVIDTKKDRYRIRVRNECSQINDEKSLSFHSKLDFEKVFDEIKRKIEKECELEKDDIMFVNEKQKNISHRVILHKDDTYKSFPINVTNYSSSQILEFLERK